MGREVHRVCEKNRDVFHRVVGSGKFSTEVHEHSTIRCGKVEALSRRKQCTWTEVRNENQAPQTERFVFRIGGKGGNSELLAGGHTGPPLRQGPDPWAAISHPAALFPCSRRLSAFHCHAAAAARREIASQTPGGPSTAFSLPWAPPCAPALFPCSARLRASLLIRTGY